MLEQEKKYKKPVFGLKMGLKGLTLRHFGLKGLILRPQKQGWLKRLDFKPPQLSEGPPKSKEGFLVVVKVLQGGNLSPISVENDIHSNIILSIFFSERGSGKKMRHN